MVALSRITETGPVFSNQGIHDMANPRRALIVIDVQNEYFSGGLPIEYPDPQVSLANIGRAIDTAEAHGIPVVLVQHLAAADSPLFARGSEGAALHPAVVGRRHALLVEKGQASAFVGTGLGEWVREQQIDTLTVVGYMTQNCDDATIKHAVTLGLGAELLSDASGSPSYANRAGQATAEEIHRVVTVTLQAAFAAVASTDAWIAAVEAGEALPRDNIYSSTRL